MRNLFGNGRKLYIGLMFGAFLAAVNFHLPLGKAQKNTSEGGGTFYTISGNVKADGTNLAGARVVLLFNSSITESATTDANGNFSLNALEGFSYMISVYKNDYNFNPSTQTLPNVQANQTINFQNGTLLCVPAPAGQTGGNFCQDATATPVSQIQNGKIAFEIFGNAFAVNANGLNQMQLPPAGSFPAWSFDGTKLLSNRTTSLDPDQEIYITNADGTGNRQITFNFFNDYKAQWSPNGLRAVFYRVFNSADIEIFTINTDSPNNGVNEVRLTDDNCLNRDPVYSPDGAKIAFAKTCANVIFSGIYTMNTDGSNPFQLTSGFVDSAPSWKPDGSQLVFVRDNDFWLVNSSGTGVTQLTFDLQFPYYSPVYSPDGTKIAFSRVPSATEYQEIYTLNPFTGEQIRLTNSQSLPFNKEYPSWQRIVAVVPATLNGGVNLAFSNVTNGGNTVATPIAPTSAGVLPANFQLFPESVAFDVRTSANFAGSAEVCFTLSNVNNQNLFNGLVIFHNEYGELIDRTSSRNFSTRRICATVTSFSPFVVAAPVAPTAASVSISGRIITLEGNGLRNAIVSLTDNLGNTQNVRTSSFGYYRFEEVAVGQTYIVGVKAKQYQFTPQIVAVTGEVRNLNFVPEN